MKPILSHLSFLWALLCANMKFYQTEYKRLCIMSFFMMVQNSMFFALWVILFGQVGELKGWQLADMARMYGIIASAVGLSLFFFNGARQLGYKVQDGSIDSFIARPRAVLPSLMMSNTSTASLGDILYGPLLWAVLGNVTWAQAPVLIGVTIFSTVIFTAMTVIIFSLSFWMKSDVRFTEQMFLVLIIVTCSLPHGQPLLIKLLMMSVLPAWYMIYLPTELVRHFDPYVFTGLALMAVFYAGLAALIFRAGLRRYVNSLT